MGARPRLVAGAQLVTRLTASKTNPAAIVQDSALHMVTAGHHLR
jgi:hypothetical protein